MLHTHITQQTSVHAHISNNVLIKCMVDEMHQSLICFVYHQVSFAQVVDFFVILFTKMSISY